MKLNNHGRSCGDSCCLRVQNLSVTIGADKILQDVNMHVHCGELVALIGPNGAGKSTFLKAILGQLEYEGVIAFSVPGQRSRKPRIGYVPQSPNFDPSDPVSVADLFSCSSPPERVPTRLSIRSTPCTMSRQSRISSRSALEWPRKAGRRLKQQENRSATLTGSLGSKLGLWGT